MTTGGDRAAVLVTGADVGIGAVIARVLARRWTVVAHGRGPEQAAVAAAAVREHGPAGQVLPVAFDLGRPDEVDAAWDRLDRLGVRVTAAVNNAADQAMLNDPPLDPAQFEAVFAVNTFGPLRVARHCAERLKARGESGAIVNISSLAGQQGIVGRPAYSASKAALDGVTRALALEYAASGITANAIAAGFVDNDRWTAAEPARLEWRRRNIPMGLPTGPGEIASLTEFLISGRVPTMTGSILLIDGGLSIQQVPAFAAD